MLLFTIAVVGAFPWFDNTLPRRERVAMLVGNMTTQEKIAQMVVAAPAIDRLGVGSYHWRNNVLHGDVDNGVSTQFTQAIGMAASFSPALVYKAGRVSANEQRAKYNIALKQNNGSSVMNYGLDLWGPVGNLMRDPRWGRGQETYGEDPFLATKLTEAFVDGLQNGPQTDIYQTLATCKAFAAYGVDEEPPRLSFDPNITETDLRQYYFPAWELCAKKSVSIMCSYNGINGYPMCMSPMLKAVLKDEFGFTKPENYVVTDSGALEFMVSKYHRFQNTTQAAAAGLNAGVDLNSGTVFHHLSDALEAGTIETSQLDLAVSRLFTARMAAGTFDPPATVMYSNLTQADIQSPENLQIAEDVALRSQVLVKNQDNMLPLKPSSLKKLLVVGWGANDTYSLLGNYMGCEFGGNGPILQNCSLTTPLQGIKDAYEPHGVEVTYSFGVAVESNDTSGFADAVAQAKTADYVIFVGGNRNCQGGQGKGGVHCEGEGHDRPDLQMPGQQTKLMQQLYQVNKNFILVVVTGGPISMNWEAQYAPAILVMWYGGSRGGEAVGQLLSGVVSPSGKLPMTWPVGVEQVPPKLDMALDTPPGRTYRHLTEMPLYKFGFGLTYTTVELSGGLASPNVLPAAVGFVATVCATIKNTGAYATEEVLQVYAMPPRKYSSKTPNTYLVGFQRSTLIAPQASQEVCAEVSTTSLRLMDTSFAPQPGAYEITLCTAPPNAGKFVITQSPYVNTTLSLQ
eukprot:TRINITY_DN11729_c0_g1_i1.p1 TRINITY_DN11729_c0_g1~~TRINITY_DN11729_c0_g1_i1.p1  ORF type:complete len:751 (+),score=181.34 TRINITY_DN11729_c0_g1_i1:41-2254(+)